MLARFKCNEIKDRCLALVESKIDNFIGQSNMKEFLANEFVDSVKDILKEAIGNGLKQF